MDYNTPINFFKSLFKIRKETLDGTEPISLAYLNPNTGAMNTGLYCTTQDIADLAPSVVVDNVTITGLGTIGSPLVAQSSGSNNILETKINLTASEIINIGDYSSGAPAAKTLIATPGVGKYIEVISASVKVNPGNSSFTQSASFHIATSTNGAPIFLSSTVATTGTAVNITPMQSYLNAGVFTQYKEDSGLVLYGGDVNSGNGTVTIYISYRIVTI